MPQPYTTLTKLQTTQETQWITTRWTPNPKFRDNFDRIGHLCYLPSSSIIPLFLSATPLSYLLSNSCDTLHSRHNSKPLMLTNSDNGVVFPRPSPPVNSPCWCSPTDCGRKGRHKTLHTNNVRNVWRGFLSLLGIAVLLQLIIVYHTSRIWRFRRETRFKTSTRLAITRRCDNRGKPTAQESDSWLV